MPGRAGGTRNAPDRSSPTIPSDNDARLTAADAGYELGPIEHVIDHIAIAQHPIVHHLRVPTREPAAGIVQRHQRRSRSETY
jgi:hypothetical protein